MTEGTIIEIIKLLKRRKQRYRVQADVANYEGRNKDFFWNAGAETAIEEILERIQEDTGIGEVYGREDVYIRRTDSQAHGEEGKGISEGEDPSIEQEP